MVVEVKIKGRDEVRAASLRIKTHGNSKVIRKEFTIALKEAADPAAEDVKQAALALPAKSHRRVLRQRIADSVSVQVKSTGKDPSVKIGISRSKMKDKAPVPMLMDRGPFRHKVFGREKWVTQEGHKEWFERSVERDVPEVRERIKETADHIAKSTVDKVV